MADIVIRPAKKIRGEITPPPNKSISHRAVMIGSIAKGTSRIKNLLLGEDIRSTIGAFRSLGVEIDELGDNSVVVSGKGPCGLKKPGQELYLGNSGTTMRLLMGILAGQPFECTLTGDESLSRRPMKRVTKPLRMMGAEITGPEDANYAPVKINGGPLRAVEYETQVASAQVKSAILLAGLYAKGETCVSEPHQTRDHTERMLKVFGADVKSKGRSASVEGPADLCARDVIVPGDISSASFFIVAAAILGGSSLRLKSVGLNPTRTGVLDILGRMGANIKIEDKKEGVFEPAGDIVVSSSSLRAAEISGSDIVRSIDELPIIMVAACFAYGTTLIKGASELRVKETDRIDSMVSNLKKMGADIQADGDDVIIKGPNKLTGAGLSSYKDHRTAMSLAIAGLGAKGETSIDHPEYVAISFPEFFTLLNGLTGK